MTRRGKKGHVNDDTFAELMKSAEQALAYERGDGMNYRVTQIRSEHPRITSREGKSLGSTLRIRREHKKPSNK